MQGGKKKVIAINTRALLLNRLDGIGWFTYQVVKRWVQSYPEVQFYFIFDRKYDDCFIFGNNVIPVVISPPARHPILWYCWYEISIPRLLDRIQPDIFISLDTYTTVRWKGRKITAIHDIAFSLFDGHVDRLTQWFLRKFTPRYIQTSEKIVTVSHATKKDLMAFYGCSEEKIIVTHNAPADVYKPMPIDAISHFKKVNTEGRDYFIFVGSIHPRKNITTLLQAFESFKKTYATTHKLVLIGRMSWKCEDVKCFLGNMDYRSDVIQIDHSPPEKIAQWLGAATALIMVSLYEGFGVPIIEALASGIPVICSNTSSMPEVAGGGAILVSPTNIDEIASAMYTLSSDQEMRTLLIEKGSSHIKQYNWDKAAEVIWKEIE